MPCRRYRYRPRLGFYFYYVIITLLRGSPNSLPQKRRPEKTKVLFWEAIYFLVQTQKAQTPKSPKNGSRAWKSKRRTERPTSSIFSHNKCPTCAPRPHRYMAPIQDMGIPEAGRYPCASYAKVSAPSGTCCTRTYDSKQSTCVRVDEKGPLMRRDPERVTADQSLQNRRDTRPRYVLK